MSSPYAFVPIWLIWREIPFPLKLFWLVLIIVGIRILFSAFATLATLRLLSIPHKAAEEPPAPSLDAFRIRAENMRQLLSVTANLFGFVFCWILPWVMLTLDNSKTPGGILVMRNFFVDIGFAANVFSVFLVLHSIQWFVSKRVNIITLSATLQPRLRS
jgi:hypothetical protein